MLRAPLTRRARPGRGAVAALGLLTFLALSFVTVLGVAADGMTVPAAGVTGTGTADAPAEDTVEHAPYAPADEPLAAAPDRTDAGVAQWYRLPLWLQAWIASGFLALAVLLGARALRWLAHRLNGEGEVTW